MLNNPVRYSDPTGHWEDEGCGTGGPGGGTGCNLPPPSNSSPGGGGNNGNSGGGGNGGGGCTSLSCMTGNMNPFSGGVETMSSILVGFSSVYSSPTSSYAEQTEEGSCGGCSMEPIEVANPFDLFNFAGGWGLSYLAINSQDIPVYANIISNNGSISVNSLTVDNTNTGATISVMQVIFNVSGSPTSCLVGQCLSSASYGYSVQPQLGYYPSNVVATGIGAITPPLSTQVVDLVPSGYPNNPTNTFYNEVTLVVVLGNSLTGDAYNPISVSLRP